MVKGLILFAAGAVAGMSFVHYELMTEKLIVNYNLDGGVTFHHPGIFRKNPNDPRKRNS